MAVFVRTFRQADMPMVRDLLKQLGYEIAIEELTHRITRVLSSTNHYFVVAEQAERVVGLVHVFERPALEKPCEAVVQALVVDAKVRGQSVGKILMEAAEVWTKARGLASISLHTRQAQAFYASLGYVKVSTSDLFRKAMNPL